MTIRNSLPWLFLSSTVLLAGIHACGTGDVSPPRNQGGNSNGVGGNFGSGTGGNFGSGTGGNFGSGTGGSSSGSTGGSNGSSGSFGSGTGGSNGSSGSFGSGTGGSNGSSGSFGSGSGGSSAGTGGSSVIGAGGSPGTGGTQVGMNSTFAMNGFGMITAPAWNGYLYTGTYGNATITPQCTSGAPTAAMPCFSMSGALLCVNGGVTADPTNMGLNGAFFGWNVGQPQAGGAAAGTAATTGTSLTLTFAGSVAGFRVALDDASAPATQWCFNVPATAASTVTIPWTMFRTKCYAPATDPTSIPYVVGTPIKDIQVVIPSGSTGAVPFNFCWVSVSVQ